MLMLGGTKRKEMISARLGDVLSHLYMASAVLKRFEDEGRQAADLPYVHYAVQSHLHKIVLTDSSVTFLNAQWRYSCVQWCSTR